MKLTEMVELKVITHHAAAESGLLYMMIKMSDLFGFANDL